MHRPLLGRMTVKGSPSEVDSQIHSSTKKPSAVLERRNTSADCCRLLAFSFCLSLIRLPGIGESDSLMPKPAAACQPDSRAFASARGCPPDSWKQFPCLGSGDATRVQLSLVVTPSASGARALALSLHACANRRQAAVQRGRARLRNALCP